MSKIDASISDDALEGVISSCPGGVLDVDGVPRLPAAQQLAWVGFLAAHSEILRALDSGLAREFGLSVSALEVLAQLAADSEGQIRMSDLATGALLSQSRVSRIVDQLELRGLVRRTSCASDSRVVYALITPAGSELAGQALHWHWAQVQERFFARLDEDQVAALGLIWPAILGRDPGGNACSGG
jgi:DNA-binding MarR family transcriptional regulator